MKIECTADRQGQVQSSRQMALTHHLIKTYGQEYGQRNQVNNYVSKQHSSIRQKATVHTGGAPCGAVFTLCDMEDSAGETSWSLIMRDGNDFILAEILTCIRTGLQMHAFSHETASIDVTEVFCLTWVQVFEREQALVNAVQEFGDSLNAALHLIETDIGVHDDLTSLENFAANLCCADA